MPMTLSSWVRRLEGKRRAFSVELLSQAIQKTQQPINSLLGSFLLRGMSSLLQSEELDAGHIVPQPIPILQRNDLVILAPDCQRRYGDGLQLCLELSDVRRDDLLGCLCERMMRAREVHELRVA